MESKTYFPAGTTKYVAVGSRRGGSGVVAVAKVCESDTEEAEMSVYQFNCGFKEVCLCGSITTSKPTTHNLSWPTG